MSERRDFSQLRAQPGQAVLPGATRATASAPRSLRVSRRPLGARRERAPDPVLSEEEAVDLLYGRRTGTVVASPASPPLH